MEFDGEWSGSGEIVCTAFCCFTFQEWACHVDANCMGVASYTVVYHLLKAQTYGYTGELFLLQKKHS